MELGDKTELPAHATQGVDISVLYLLQFCMWLSKICCYDIRDLMLHSKFSKNSSDFVTFSE